MATKAQTARNTAITLGVIGAVGYAIYLRRQAIRRRAIAGGVALADRGIATVQGDPQGVLDLAMIAQDLGLRASDYTGYGQMSQRRRPPRGTPFQKLVVISALALPFTLWPWVIGKFKPEWSYGKRTALVLGALFALRVSRKLAGKATPTRRQMIDNVFSGRPALAERRRAG